MKAKPHELASALARPDPGIRLYLLHGPDEAGAGALAARLQQALGRDVERVDIDGASLRSHPGRLADEAASISLFGRSRLIRVAPAGEECLEAFALLLQAPAGGNPVIAIGPSLKSTGKLVKLVADARNALACNLFIPTGKELAKLAASMAREQGLRLTPDLVEALADGCSGDRSILAREVEKLALYLDAAPDRPRDADMGAWAKIGAGVAEPALFETIEAIIAGLPMKAGDALETLEFAGVSPVPLLRQLAKRLILLAEMRGEMDEGMGVKEVMERRRFFSRDKDATLRALRRWSSPQLARAVERVRQAERAVMAGSSAGSVLARTEALAIARAAARFG